MRTALTYYIQVKQCRYTAFTCLSAYHLALNMKRNAYVNGRTEKLQDPEQLWSS